MVKKSIVVVGLAVLCSLILVACSGNGDSDSDNPIWLNKNDFCKVVSQKSLSLVIESVEDGYFSRTTLVYKDGRVTEEVEFESSAIAEKACPMYKKDSDYGSVTCEGKKVVSVSEETLTISDYERLMDAYVESCEDYNEEMMEERETAKRSSSSKSRSSSSSVRSSSSSSVRSSSSSSSRNPYAYDDYDDDYDDEISSSSRESAWDDRESSSSGDGELSDGSFKWVGSSKYKKEKVVASNADDLECEENTPAENLEGYDVAYEFNSPYDMGRDYLGDNHAYIDNIVPAVSAECGSLVLNGNNGLLIPLNDIFKNRGFVIEVRFMPTRSGDMSNIFVAEPPGSGVDGWQVRFDGNTVSFHIRDSEQSGNWTVNKIDEISLNEWHVFRVKIFPSTSGTGEVFYSMNISLDGNLRYASEFRGDVSDLEYGLGIGYDSMNQGLHERRFFTGKIDYIRYGKVSED